MHSPPTAGGGGGGIEPFNKFSKRGGLDRTSNVRQGLLGKGEGSLARKRGWCFGVGKVDTPMLTMEVKDMEFPRVLKKRRMKIPQG